MLALACVVSVFATSAHAEETPVSLTLPEARATAEAALRHGRPKLAYSISEGLLQADAHDPRAHYLRAVALGQLEQFDEGRKSAAKAFRSSNTPLQRHQAAKLAEQGL